MKKTALLLVPVVLGVLLTGCKAEEGSSPRGSASTAVSAQDRWDDLSKSKRDGICEAALDGDSAGMLKALESAGFGDDLEEMVPVAIDECSKSG